MALVGFRVELRELRVVGLSRAEQEGEEGKSERNVYLRLDFDAGFERLETPFSKNSEADLEITWPGCSKSFQYRTKHGDALDRKSLKIECLKHSVLFSDKRLGEAEISLHDLATGPSSVDLVMRDAKGKPIGHVLMIVDMQSMADAMTIGLSEVTVTPTVPVEAGCCLFMAYSRRAHEPVQSRPHSNACAPGENLSWSDLPLLQISGATGVELAEEFVVLKLKNQQGKMLAEACLSLLEHLTFSRKPVTFTGNLFTERHEAAGVVTGTLAFNALPKFVQLAGGVMTAAGVVDKTEGFPDQGPPRRLFEGTPLPASLDGCNIAVAASLAPGSDDGGGGDSGGGGGSTSVGVPLTVALAAARNKTLSTPANRPALERTPSANSAQMDKMIEQLQHEHERKLAGLRFKFEEKREAQKARLEARVRARKQLAERRKALEAVVPPKTPLASEASEAKAAETPRELRQLVVEAEQNLYQELMGRPPRSFSLSAAAAAEPLPVGWHHRFAEDGSKFYAYSREGCYGTSWTDPRLVPDDWVMRVSARGALCFFHEPTCISVENADPRGLPEGWVAFPDMDSGKLVFSNSGNVTERDPRGLPPGTSAKLGPTGEVAFVNADNGEETTEDPRYLSGVTDDVRAAWLELERVEWEDAAAQALREKELQSLDELYNATITEFDAWVASQRAVAAAALDALQLRMIREEPAKSCSREAHERATGAFSNIIANLDAGWADERRKLDLEFARAQGAVLQ